MHLLAVNGPADLTRGSATERQEKYLAALRRFPATLNPRLLEQGQQICPVIAVPETMLRGFVRPAPDRVGRWSATPDCSSIR